MELIDALAARAAPEQQHRLLCPSVQQCEGVLRVRMRTRLCFVGARARHVCCEPWLHRQGRSSGIFPYDSRFSGGEVDLRLVFPIVFSSTRAR